MTYQIRIFNGVFKNLLIQWFKFLSSQLQLKTLENQRQLEELQYYHRQELMVKELKAKEVDRLYV